MAAGETTLSSEGGGLAARELVHELRNLLAVVVNYCELIADETADPEAVRSDLNEIRVAAERALALTDKIPVPSKGASSHPAGDAI